MRIFSNFDEIKSAVGTEIGVSDWIEVTQDRINQFAEATCDEQWIHVDQSAPGGKRQAAPPSRTACCPCRSRLFSFVR